MPNRKGSDPSAQTLDKLDRLIGLLQWLVAIRLWERGISQVAIAKRLGIGTVRVNDMLKGVKKGKLNEQKP